jgi:eukaryotic-like serine/threonine-protein kinase
MAEPAAGASLGAGRYRLVTRLGGGGMASVWLARDTRLDREVAVKLIAESLAQQPRYVERFSREARIAAGLSHPNLVAVYDFGSDADRPFLVMEYVDGGTLAPSSGNGTGHQLEPDQLARELLGALGHIHAAGIVHRDVKPGNVLVGGDGRPRLTDFGIAREEDSTGLTETGQVIGTLKYIAPEVAHGKPATPTSDLYSLGVLLSEVAPADPPPRLAGLIARLIESDPARRPATAAEAIATLDGDWVTAATRVVIHRRRVGRSALAVVSALALAAVVVILIATSGSGGSSNGASTPKAAPSAAPLSRQLNSLDRAVDQDTQR